MRLRFSLNATGSNFAVFLEEDTYHRLVWQPAVRASDTRSYQDLVKRRTAGYEKEYMLCRSGLPQK